MQNYKYVIVYNIDPKVTCAFSRRYKAKLVPGINRRGKGMEVCNKQYCFTNNVTVTTTAAKAALFRFIQSKETSQREKDLLKSVKVINSHVMWYT